MHVIQFYQAFPRVSTASDKHWGEKAGYDMLMSIVHVKTLVIVIVIIIT